MNEAASSKATSFEPSWRRGLLLWLLVLLVLKLMQWGHDFLGSTFADIGTVAVMLYLPVELGRRQAMDLSWLSYDGSSFRRDLKIFLPLVLGGGALLALLHHGGRVWLLGQAYHPSGVGSAWGMVLLTQILVVGLPEEVLFRGYLREHWSAVFSSRWRWGPLTLGWGTLLQALVFALSHSVMSVQPWHILIFFPALLFEALRQISGRIYLPAVVHGLCNGFSFWALSSYR